VPAYIGNDLRARLQAVPKTKLVGYYSDAYKLEFVLPKYSMYRRVLGQLLAEEFVETKTVDRDRRGGNWASGCCGIIVREIFKRFSERSRAERSFDSCTSSRHAARDSRGSARSDRRPALE